MCTVCKNDMTDLIKLYYNYQRTRIILCLKCAKQYNIVALGSRVRSMYVFPGPNKVKIRESVEKAKLARSLLKKKKKNKVTLREVLSDARVADGLPQAGFSIGGSASSSIEWEGAIGSHRAELANEEAVRAVSEDPETDRTVPSTEQMALNEEMVITYEEIRNLVDSMTRGDETANETLPPPSPPMGRRSSLWNRVRGREE